MIRKSNYPSYVAWNLATIFRHMSGKFVTASHSLLPVKALVNTVFFALNVNRN